MSRPRRVAVVTGSRAEFGLLRPVMMAVQGEASLELLVIAAGSHLIQPAVTFRDVKRDFPVADGVPMQVAGRTGRAEDAEALGKGVSRFARSFRELNPDWVLVLGDRIEAFAAASAASVGGWTLAHVHGGDRAEGIADEAMRHAITKLAHVHFAATEASAERIRRMGERPELVHNVGSPAIDDLVDLPPLNDDAYTALGSPAAVVLMHPIGRHAEEEEMAATSAIEAAGRVVGTDRVLALHPNHDAGRHGVVRAIEQSGARAVAHLERAEFIGLLKRVARERGVLVGNSSAGLIEGAAIPIASVDIGPRQAGRECTGNVVHADGESSTRVESAIRRARDLDLNDLKHPYGDGLAGQRIARVLSRIDPSDTTMLRKRCAY